MILSIQLWQEQSCSSAKLVCFYNVLDLRIRHFIKKRLGARYVFSLYDIRRYIDCKRNNSITAVKLSDFTGDLEETYSAMHIAPFR